MGPPLGERHIKFLLVAHLVQKGASVVHAKTDSVVQARNQLSCALRMVMTVMTVMMMMMMMATMMMMMMVMMMMMTA